MFSPYKMNLMDICWKKININSSFKDNDINQPRSYKKHQSKERIIKGQVSPKVFSELNRQQEGDIPITDLYLVFSTAYLEKNNISFQKGDYITKIANYNTDLKVKYTELAGHLRGNAILTKVHLEDRVRK